jgi:effector-binding domain-containing protein
MEVKSVKARNIFYHSEVTTMNDTHKVAVREIDTLYSEAEKLGLKETGPMQFVYHDCDDKRDTKFTLEIALAIDQEKPYEGKYKFKELEAFNCASTLHHGDINNIGETNEKLIPEVFKSGIQITHQSREVYHKWVDSASPENVTEIQIGIN